MRHTELQRLACRDLKGEQPAFDEADKVLRGGLLLPASLRPAQ